MAPVANGVASRPNPTRSNLPISNDYPVTMLSLDKCVNGA